MASYAIPVLPEAFQKGLTGIAVCGGLSFTCTSILLMYLGYKAYRASRDDVPPSANGPNQSQYSIHTQGYFWLVNLFVADLIQSLGVFLSTDSLIKNAVIPGPMCTLQGLLIQSGDISSSIWAAIIAFHTFFLLAGGRNWRAWAAEKSTSGKARWILCFGVWFCVLFIGLIGLILIENLYPDKGPFYNQAGAGWCWISAPYFYERIFFHYAFLFIDMFALTMLYCFLFFYIRVQLKNFRAANSSSTDHQTGGTGTGHELRPWHANLEAGLPHGDSNILPNGIMTKTTVTVTTEDRPNTIYSGRRQRTEAGRAHRRMNQVALTLLCYPVSYILLTMPICITRLSQFAGNNWGLVPIYVAACLYCCSGFCNVLLYTLTRRGIISWGWLFKRRGRKSSTKKGGASTTSPGYYPGSRNPTTLAPSTTIKSKPSTVSISNFPQTPKSNLPDSDSDSYSGEFPPNVVVSDAAKLVHQKDCILEQMDFRTSNGSTLIGECTCKTPPRSPQSLR